MDKYYVATFYSTSQALRFEKSMLQQALSVKMIPVPRIISSSCGLAARFTEADWPAVAQTLAAGTAEAEEVYLFAAAGKSAQAERIWARDNE